MRLASSARRSPWSLFAEVYVFESAPSVVGMPGAGSRLALFCSSARSSHQPRRTAGRLTRRAHADDAKARAKAVREYGKNGGSEIIPKLETVSFGPRCGRAPGGRQGDRRHRDPAQPGSAGQSHRRQRSGNPDSRHRRPGELLCARLREDRADRVAAAGWLVHQRPNLPTPTIW